MALQGFSRTRGGMSTTFRRDEGNPRNSPLVAPRLEPPAQLSTFPGSAPLRSALQSQGAKAAPSHPSCPCSAAPAARVRVPGFEVLGTGPLVLSQSQPHSAQPHGNSAPERL